MSDPYRDAFARDYMASKDFARMYGIDKPIVLRFFQFGTKDAKDPSNYRAPATPRPVVWFVEHQRLPMFVNNTSMSISSIDSVTNTGSRQTGISFSTPLYGSNAGRRMPARTSCTSLR